jgi:hypothetical protein
MKIDRKKSNIFVPLDHQSMEDLDLYTDSLNASVYSITREEMGRLLDSGVHAIISSATGLNLDIYEEEETNDIETIRQLKEAIANFLAGEQNIEERTKLFLNKVSELSQLAIDSSTGIYFWL